jgi:hypothetical protein
MLKLKQLKYWIDSLPYEFLEYDVVSSEETVYDDAYTGDGGGYTLRKDAPIIKLNVDEDTKEILLHTK